MLNREQVIEKARQAKLALVTERKVEVRTYLVHADHTGCTGEFKSTGEAYMTYPPKYIHLCTVCGQDETFKEQYPITRVEEIQ